MGPQLRTEVNDKCSKEEWLTTSRAGTEAISKFSKREKHYLWWTTSALSRSRGWDLPFQQQNITSVMSQTPSSAEQIILPTGGNGLWQQVVGKGTGDWFPPQASQSRGTLPWLRLSEVYSPWCVQASETDVIDPSVPCPPIKIWPLNPFSSLIAWDQRTKSCLQERCAGAWDRVVDVYLFWGRICWNLNPSLLLCIKGPQRVYGLWNNHKAVKEILKWRALASTL